MLARGSTTICLVQSRPVVVGQTSQTLTRRSSSNSSLEMEALKRFSLRLLVLKWVEWAVGAAVKGPEELILSSRWWLKQWVDRVKMAQMVHECSKWDLECSPCLLEGPWVVWAVWAEVAGAVASPAFNSSQLVPNKEEDLSKCSEKVNKKKRKRLKKYL